MQNPGPRRRRRNVALRRRVAAGTAALVVLLVAFLVVHVTVAPSSARHRHTQTTQRTAPTNPRQSATSTSTSNATTSSAPQPVWRVAWGSAMAWGHDTATNVTVRELATVGVGGQGVKVRISNTFGNAPMVIGAATVGVDAGAATVQPGTIQPLTFNGQPGTTVPIGQEVVSDPVNMTVTDEETLAISVYVVDPDLVTVHPCCTTQALVSFSTPNGGGNLTASTTSQGFSLSSWYPRWVDAVDVLQTTGHGSIVVIGDSITDGFNSTLRWTDVLQQRIDQLPASEQRAVVNEGISANALTSDVPTDSTTGGGPSGLSRLGTDALDLPGVSEVVLFLGTNDIYFGASAQDVIAGYEQAIAEVHQAGIRIIGVTIIPRNPGADAWTPTDQIERQQVNTWMATSGQFDGVLNFAGVVADVYDGACSPTLTFPPYNAGDNIHPNAAGQVAMADSVDPAILELPPLPLVPPLVTVTPTPGCNTNVITS